VFKNLPIVEGEAHVGRIDLKFLKSFPEVKFSIDSLTYFQTDGEPSVLHIGELTGSTNFSGWRNRTIRVDSIQLHQSFLNYIIDSKGNSNIAKQQESTENKPPKVKIDFNPDLFIDLSEFSLNYIDSTKQKHIKAVVHSLENQVNLADSTGVFKFDIFSEHLTFNWTKGPYLANSRASGLARIERTDSGFVISSAQTNINEQTFDIEARFYKQSSGKPTELSINNNSTSWYPTVALLPTHLQNQLSDYAVKEAFPTKTNILFTDAVNPRVRVDFILDNTTTQAKGKSFYINTANGQFYNRIYDQEFDPPENKQNIRIEFDNLIAKYDAFRISSPKTWVTYSEPAGEQFSFNGRIEGQTKQLSSFFDNEKFKFTAGEFDLRGNASGRFRDMTSVLETLDAEFTASNTTVTYTATKSNFVFDILWLKKTGNLASYDVDGTIANSKRSYSLSGEIEEFNDLFTENKEKSLTTSLTFISPHLSWADLTDLTANSTEEENNNSVKTTKQLFAEIYNKFHPEFDMQVDTISYQNQLFMYDFSTKLAFENSHKLSLLNTNFNLDQGDVGMEANVDFTTEEKTNFLFDFDANSLNLQDILPSVNYFQVNLLKELPHLSKDINLGFFAQGSLRDDSGFIPHQMNGDLTFKNNTNEPFRGKVSFSQRQKREDLHFSDAMLTTSAYIEGHPNLLNRYFADSDFTFLTGNINLQADYEGNVNSIEDIIRDANLTLNLDSTNLLYKKSNIVFPVTTMTANIENNTGLLQLKYLKDSSNIQVDAEVKSISDLIYHPTKQNHSITASLLANTIDWAAFQNLFTPPPADTLQVNVEDEPTDTLTKKEKVALRKTLVELLRSFNPDLSVDIRELLVDTNFLLTNVEANLLLKDSSVLILKETGFDYLDGSISANAELELLRAQEIPFKAKVNTTEFDLPNFLQQHPEFNLLPRERIDSLGGALTLYGEIEGLFAEQGIGLISAETNAIIDFDLQNFTVIGFEDLQSIGKNIIMKHRFDSLRFAPISNRVLIQDGDLYLPFMEVQSNTGNFFIEGGTIEDRRSIWITVPLKTVLSGVKNIGEITNVDSYKNKVFVELTEDEGEPKTNFYFSKKQFFIERYPGSSKGEFLKYKKQVQEARKARIRKQKEEKQSEVKE